MKLKQPLPEDFEGKTDNIYEAIMVAARRARKISVDQKMEFEKAIQNAPPPEEQPEGTETVPDDDNPYLELEKPTRIALNELYNAELEYEYRD